MSLFRRWFGTSGKARQAAAVAAQEAERARRIQQAALTNPQDSDIARSAAERRLRRIGAMRGVSGARTGQGGTGRVLQTTLGGG